MQRFLNIRNTCVRTFPSTPQVPISRLFNSRRPTSTFLNISRWSDSVIVSLEKRKFHTSVWSSAEIKEGDTSKLEVSNAPHQSSKINESSSVDDVVRWAEQFVGRDHASKLKNQEINGKALLELTEDDLKEMTIPIGPKRSLLIELKKLKEPQTQDLPPISWREPIPLVRTIGSTWEYQQSEEINHILQDSLSKHYDCWKLKNTDKQSHPLFLITSGVGTGKSRLLQELPRLAKEAIPNDSELGKRLENAFVFHVSFENGTAWIPEVDTTAGVAISSRMLWQVTDKFSNFHTLQTVLNPSTTPFIIIEALAKSLRKDVSELTIFLLVDGIQKLPHRNREKDSLFYSIVSIVAQLTNECKAFVIGCCSATIRLPINEVLAQSPQWREFLPIPLVEGHRIFKDYEPNPIREQLVDDAGGHGRALECVKISWDKITANKNYHLSTLMEDVQKQLEQKYPEWIDCDKEYLTPVFRAILANHRFQNKKDVIPGTSCTVDQICSLGLINYDVKSCTLSCAFVWLRSFVYNPNDRLLYNIIIGNYNAIQDHLDNSNYFLPNWTQWEIFNAYFRCLKSIVLAGQVLPFRDLHHSAVLNCEKFDVTVTKLEFAQASHKYETRSSGPDKIQTEDGTFNVSTCSQFFINAHSASAGDGWCGLQCNPTRREIHQYKLVKEENLTKEKLQEERKKAADPNDIFLMFSIYQNHDLTKDDLPLNTGLVLCANFKEYYGPFAGRAFYITSNTSFRPNANTSQRSQLEASFGIGAKRAEAILEERKKKPFQNLEDCHQRTKIPLPYLLPFNW